MRKLLGCTFLAICVILVLVPVALNVGLNLVGTVLVISLATVGTIFLK